MPTPAAILRPIPFKEGRYIFDGSFNGSPGTRLMGHPTSRISMRAPETKWLFIVLGFLCRYMLASVPRRLMAWTKVSYGSAHFRKHLSEKLSE